MGSAEFLAVLDDLASSTDTLSAGEQRFLVDQGIATVEEVDPARQVGARRRLTAAAVRADAAALDDGDTTGDVARMLRTAPANVRRAISRGEMYTAGRTRNREHILPRWQFRSGRPLPGLADVLAVIPDDYHPLDVGSFFTTPAESLRGRTPADWLAGHGDPHAVTRLADELGRW